MTSATSLPTLPPTRPTRRAVPVLMLAVTMALALFGSSIGTAEAAVDVEAKPVPKVERLRLFCDATNIDGERGVACRWSGTTESRTRAYQLYKITDGGVRELVATVPGNGRLGHFDTNVESPSTVTYGVIALNRSGRLVGRSAPKTVQYGTTGG